QDPAKADKITKIQRDLDETTEVLVRRRPCLHGHYIL
ncbi:unnamed protein product, partial [Ectocarpus sp. 8 AP-2014]